MNREFQEWQESSASNESILQYLKSEPFAKDTPLVLPYKNSMHECVPLEKKCVLNSKVFIIIVCSKGVCFVSVNFNQDISQSHISVSSASFTPVIYNLDIVVVVDAAFSMRFFWIYVLENQPLDNHLVFFISIAFLLIKARKFSESIGQFFFSF